MIHPKNSDGLVAFSREPLLCFMSSVLPDGTFPPKTHFKLKTLSHQEILDIKKKKYVGTLEFLGNGEVYSSMRVLSWLLKLEQRQMQATLASMSFEKLLQPEDLEPGKRIHGITRQGEEFIRPTGVFRLFSTGKTSPRTLLHRLLCQQIRIQLEKFYDAECWISEKILFEKRTYPNVPDGVFTYMHLQVAMEVELSFKTIEDQKNVLQGYCDILSETDKSKEKISKVIFFTPEIERLVERINKYVPDEFKHCFFVQYIQPFVMTYKSGSYMLNSDLLNFLNAKV